MQRQFHIGLPKILTWYCIGPPKINRLFLIGPLQGSLNLLLPEFHRQGTLLNIFIMKEKQKKQPIGKKNGWRYYRLTSRDSVFPVCGNFILPTMYLSIFSFFNSYPSLPHVNHAAPQLNFIMFYVPVGFK